MVHSFEVHHHLIKLMSGACLSKFQLFTHTNAECFVSFKINHNSKNLNWAA